MAGPLLTRRQLGQRLMRLRVAAGLSPYDVVRSGIVKSRRTLGRLEAGHPTTLTWPAIGQLARAYGADTGIASELERMYRAADEPGWWEPFRVPRWFQLFLELEQTASVIRVYEVEFVTGLLQTEDYMRALYAANRRLDKATISRAVASRLLRQREFWARAPAARLEVVMSEGAVRRAVGGTHVHADQWEALREAARRPDVGLYVIPDSEGAHPAMGSAFMLMEFPDDLDPNVVYSEAANGARYEDSATEFDHHRDTFDATREIATALEEFRL